MDAPNVVTTLRNKELNFVFRVRAYRNLTQIEIERELAIWMQQSNTKRIPRNQTVEVISIRGFSPEEGL